MSDFQVLREGGTPVDIVPAEEGLGSVVALAERIASGEVSGKTDDEIDVLARSLKPALGEAATDPFKTWLEYVDVFEDTLYALAYNIDLDNRLSLDLQRLEAIVRDNPHTCCSVAALYRAVPRMYPDLMPPEKVASRARLADLIDAFAAKAGYDHAAAADRYARGVGLPQH
jgi:hypothetical protein